MKSFGSSRGLTAWTVSSLSFALLSLLFAVSAMAQVTSSNIRGQVTDQSGEGIANAVVEIVHVPSGTVSTAETGPSGQFFQSGLRVGGPYRITVTADDYRGSDLDEIFLQPGSQDPFRFVLEGDTADLDAITVTSVALPAAVELNNGVGSTYSARDIANMPTTERDVLKTIARDPLANSDSTGELTVAGTNPRFNGLSIDGSLQQDDFGLGSNTYATARSPINLDVIESATLVASDYSVTTSGFTGGLVNVVTKSGSNEFDGSIYYAYQDDSFIGDDYDGGRFNAGEFEEEEYGFFVSGPIIKDRLFFLLSYDEYDTSSPVDFARFDSDNQIDPAFFTTVTNVVQDLYGFNAQGRPAASQIPETSERLLAKVDWNINYDHRASFTYQSTEETGTSVGAGEFVSAWYDIPVDLEAYTAQLFSDWTYNFSTTLRINYKEFSRGQNCRAGAGVGAFELDDWQQADLVGTPFEGLLGEDQGGAFILGCDRFRHANVFEDDRLQIFASGDYFFGDHVLTFGAEYEEYNLFNLFLASSNGRFVFETPQQLLNRTPAFVDYVNVPSNNVNDGASEWGYNKLTFFVQDRWAVTPDFELSYGLRYERFDQSDSPAFSQEIFDTYGVDSSNNLDGNDLIMPRVGFLWQPWARTTISGGFGLFAGGDPKVWTSNAFQPLTNFARSRNVTNADIFNVPAELIAAVANGGSGVPIDYIADDFETPSDWKASLRFERSFDINDFFGMDWGNNYLFSAQYLYTRSRDGFTWRNLAQTNLADALPTGVAPDGRVIYADLNDLDIINLTELGNVDGAESHTFTLQLAKVFDNGFNFDISYAYQDVESPTPGTSSRGISNWRSLYTTDRNNPDPTVSPFQTEHAFKIALGYENTFIGDLSTRFDLFGQFLSGDQWSTAFDISSSNALFGRAGAGESPFDNSPLYIPSPGNDPLVVYGSGFDVEGFFNYVNQNGISTGQIHDPYSNRSAWNSVWDLRIQQELPGIPGLDRFIGDNRFKLILDIDNVLNLIDSDWGRWDDGPSFGQANIVQADLISVADLNALGVDGAPALRGDDPRTVCQSASDCVYRYNDFDNDPVDFTSASRSIYEIRLTLRYDF
ncbi:Putative Outer membrane protein with a TonB box [Wenzhouxiangella marina]|uniref:Putative Outer membrane protein with a TonB box n=2 Tax=Wenzhouxiangella marina TaxID=1579979 RepID=A0A0K0XYH9_9GAMM|nr:Putative Outer membrane protein with a TonB box [Wenzhouxiangella marina]